MLIAVDTEVPGLESRKGLKPFIISTCSEEDVTKFWEWPLDPHTRKVLIPDLHRREVAKYLSGHEIIFHHGQFDMRIMANAGLCFAAPYWQVPSVADHSFVINVPAIHDTLFMSHLVDSRGVYKGRGKKTHALKELCLVRLNVSDIDEIKLRKAITRARKIAGSDGLGWDTGTGIGQCYWLPKALWEYRHGQQAATDELKIPMEWADLCSSYACRDVRERTMMLFLTCREILKRDGRWKLYEEEKFLLPIYYMMEETGLRLDPKRSREQIKLHRDAAEGHLYTLRDLANNHDLNIDSPLQLRKLLYEQWEQKVSRRTKKTNQPSTNAATLGDLRDYLAFKEELTDAEGYAYEFLEHMIGVMDYEVDPPIVKRPGYRQHTKMLGYLESYKQKQIKNQLHGTIHGSGTGTTRISMSNPNNTNVSKKKVNGVSLREAFGPEEEHIWLSIDYQQLELVIFANLSGDKSMIEAFENGYDFHAFVAQGIFNLSPEKISSEQRRIAKNTNFAMIYGGSPAKVDATAGMVGAYDNYAKQFPSAANFMEDTINDARTYGFIETADGYPLYAPANEPYKATDYRVQGTAGRIIKQAMKWAFYGRQSSEMFSQSLQRIIDWKRIKLLVQIHDELVFDIDVRGQSRQDTLRTVHLIEKTMEEAGRSMGITTRVDAKIHINNWADGITLREYSKAA